MKIQVLDTTLRDGAQGYGIAFTRYDKLKIVKALDSLGVDLIEVGNFALKEDMRLLEDLKSLSLENAAICMFGSTCHPHTPAEFTDDLRAVGKSHAEYISIFGKASLLHVKEILRTDAEENLRMIRDTVAYLVKCGKKVLFDAEHFFDGYSDNAEYALSVLKIAVEAGASAIVLCDTNGGMLPDVVGMVTERVVKLFPDTAVGIHCHNDLGMASACTLAAVLSGASQVQVTVSGMGERCGNANLSTVVPLLQLKMGYSLIPSDKLQSLTATARYINEVANRSFDENEPFVGGSAFAHKAGMHVDGVNKNPVSFEHIDPAAVGNERNLLISSLSGKSAIYAKMRDVFPHIEKESPIVAHAALRVKELEAEGYRFEDAEASLILRLKETVEGRTVNDFFTLENFRVMISESRKEAEPLCSAQVKIRVGDTEEITAAEGEGPVNALDLALRKALLRFYPAISGIRLCDYRVRVLDTGDNTASKVLVRVGTTDNSTVWRTVGVSTDIIDASWQALSDSMVYFLEKQRIH